MSKSKRPKVDMPSMPVPRRSPRDRAILEIANDLERRVPGLVERAVEAHLGGRNPWGDFFTALVQAHARSQFAEAESAAVGFAKDLLDDHEFVQSTRGVHHFGALQSLAQGDVSRLDYTLMILACSLDMKKAFPSAGYSAKEKKVTQKLTRLEVAQCWAILFNAGHLFGTFATERMVLYELHQNHGFYESFRREIDQELRARVMEIVDRQDLYRFHIAIAAWRVSRRQEWPHRATCVKLIKLFFDSEDHSVARTLYRTARRLAYNRMHGLMDVAGAFAQTQHEVSVARLSPHHRLTVASSHRIPALRGPTLRLFDALDDYHNEVVFTSPEAAGLVLAHLRAFRVWRRRVEDLRDTSWLDELFRRPSDWQEISQNETQRHVFRVTYRVRGPWMAAVDQWLGDREGLWEHANFVVTPGYRATPSSPAEIQVTVDVYSYAESLPERLARHILRVLMNLRAGLDHDIDLDLGLAEFVLSQLEYAFKPGYRLHLDAVLFAGQPRFVTVGPAAQVAQHLRYFGNTSGSETRGKELKSLANLVATFPARNQIVALLCPVFVHDSEGVEITEIDGIIHHVEATEAQWSLVEVKSGKETGTKQVRRLTEHIVVPCNQCESPAGTWRIQLRSCAQHPQN